MFRGETGIDKMLTDATKGRHYQVGGCRGGITCFRCDSRSTGAVVYRKDLVKQILYTTVQRNSLKSQLTIQQHTK